MSKPTEMVQGLNLLDNLLQDMRFALRQLRKSPASPHRHLHPGALASAPAPRSSPSSTRRSSSRFPTAIPARLVSISESAGDVPAHDPFLRRLSRLEASSTRRHSLELYKSTSSRWHARAPAHGPRRPRASPRVSFARSASPLPRPRLPSRRGRAGGRAHCAPQPRRLAAALRRRPRVLGRTVALSGVPHTVVGVLPASFHFAPAAPPNSGPCYAVRHLASSAAAVTTSTAWPASRRRERGGGRRRHAHDRERLEQQYPDSNRGQGASVIPLTEAINGRIRPILLLLLGGASLLLVIATVNVASLLLVRAERRRPEISVRRALGAVRAVGAPVPRRGLVLVIGGTLSASASPPGPMQLLTQPHPRRPGGKDALPSTALRSTSGSVMFAGTVAVAAAVLFCLTPVLRPHWRSARTASWAAAARRGNGLAALGRKLVVVELAIAVVLLVGAGLLGKSLYRLLHVDIGMQPDHLARRHARGASPGYAKDEQVVALARADSRTELRRCPGSQRVGASSRAPMNATAIRCGSGSSAGHITVNTTRCTIGKSAQATSRPCRRDCCAAAHFTEQDDDRQAAGRDRQSGARPPATFRMKIRSASTSATLRVRPGPIEIDRHHRRHQGGAASTRRLRRPCTSHSTQIRPVASALIARTSQSEQSVSAGDDRCDSCASTRTSRRFRRRP